MGEAYEELEVDIDKELFEQVEARAEQMGCTVEEVLEAALRASLGEPREEERNV